MSLNRVACNFPSCTRSLDEWLQLAKLLDVEAAHGLLLLHKADVLRSGSRIRAPKLIACSTPIRHRLNITLGWRMLLRFGQSES
jgi:hypothetical protein